MTTDPAMSTGADPRAEIIQTIKNALETTWRDIEAELKRTPLQHWNESVFRFFFIRSLGKPAVEGCQTEWNTVDLLLKAGDGFAVLEFKFLACNWHASIKEPFRRKASGPSKQNFDEFCKCARKLAQIHETEWMTKRPIRIDGRFIVLAYVHNQSLGEDRGYRKFYGPENTSKIAGLHSISRLPQIDAGGGDTLHCELFEVTSLSADK